MYSPTFIYVPVPLWHWTKCTGKMKQMEKPVNTEITWCQNRKKPAVFFWGGWAKIKRSYCRSLCYITQVRRCWHRNKHCRNSFFSSLTLSLLQICRIEPQEWTQGFGFVEKASQIIKYLQNNNDGMFQGGLRVSCISHFDRVNQITSQFWLSDQRKC